MLFISKINILWEVCILEVLFQQWFDDLYMQNSPKMIQLAQRLLGSIESAEDVVQNVFIILLTKKDQVMVHPCPQAWLFATLRNQIGNELQRQKYRNAKSLDGGPEISQEDDYAFSFCDCLPSGLTSSEKEILSMLFEDGYSYEEISRKMGKSILACRTKSHRAKNHCRELLKEKKVKN